MSDLGPTLRAHRERLGLSQQALAKRAGVDPSYVGMIEQGVREPRIGIVHQLIAGLDAAAEGPLLAAAGYYVAPVADETLRELDRHLAALSPARRRALLRAFDVLVRIA